MTYPNTRSAIFLSRPNRFIAVVDMDGVIETVHVKNTGRCKELLIPGAAVYLCQAGNPNRQTNYDLIAVKKGEQIINMDSQAPNTVFYEYLYSERYISGITKIKREAKYGNSRFDFYIEADENKIFIEVKGVTLEANGIAMFPDAPTMRGVKHLNELIQCVREGYKAQAVFIIQMKDMLYFTPNDTTHPAFGEALRSAVSAGVRVIAMNCVVTPDSLSIGNEVEVRL